MTVSSKCGAPRNACWLARPRTRLASQHAFLGAPHFELTVNLRYATAIAWLLIEHRCKVLPAADDLAAQALVWQQVFAPCRQPSEFVSAWQRCILKLASAA